MTTPRTATRRQRLIRRSGLLAVLAPVLFLAACAQEPPPPPPAPAAAPAAPAPARVPPARG
jgi:hypothetical protein